MGVPEILYMLHEHSSLSCVIETVWINTGAAESLKKSK